MDADVDADRLGIETVEPQPEVDLPCVQIHDPQPGDLEHLASEFGLHELAVEDAVFAHQRPKLEVYDDTLLVVLKAAVYDDEAERVRYGDVLAMVGDDFVVVVSHGPAPVPDLDTPRHDRIRDASSPAVVLHRLVDQVVDAYQPVMLGLEIDIEEVENEVFTEGDALPTERIYRLKRQLLTLLGNTRPLIAPLDALSSASLPGTDPAMREYFRDVADHMRRVVSRAETQSALLAEALDANQTQIGIRQNEDMRRMSAWAAIFLVPTLLAGIWGMNFDNMPELDYRFGYLLAIGSMVLASGFLYWRFRKNDWL